jgi:transcription termination factor NusB
MAKRYGTEDSGAFVNGILDQILAERKKLALGGEQ